MLLSLCDLIFKSKIGKMVLIDLYKKGNYLYNRIESRVKHIRFESFTVTVA